MTPATYALHTMLIRMAKGAIKAWETWLRTGPVGLPVGTDPKVDAERFARQLDE